MDLGLIFPYFDTIGGAQIFALECLKRWKKNNDITVYSVVLNHELFMDIDLDVNFSKIDIPIKSKFMNFPLLLQQKVASKYIGEHEIYNSHMFPCHSLNLKNNIWYPHEPSRILYDLKVLMNNENLLKKLLYNVSTPFLRYIDKNSYKASLTIANSSYTSTYLENVYDINVSDIVYPGVDFKKFKNNSTKKNENNILLVSRLYKEKNVDIGIKTLSYLDKSFTMKIVGTGPYKAELIKIAECYGVSDQVEFLDFVDDGTLTSLYKEALCTIFMPYKEPFGMVALESLAAGTPIIGLKDGGGYTEIISEDYNGYLVDFNPEKIAHKIKLLQEDENKYKHMIKNCEKTAQNYTWDKTAKNMMNIFNSIYKK